jgi:ferredoxin
MKRLSEVLLDIDTVALPDSLPVTTFVPAPAEVQQSEETPTTVEPEEENVEEEDDLSLAEPWIDSILCTTCNECTDLNNNMFKYNDDKQAYLADASAGTFAEFVEAAEKCPPNIIHPGVPLNPNENGLEDLIKRAEPYN